MRFAQAQAEQGAAGATPAANSIVMVTLDRHIDRRILLEADALEQAGWSVRILAAPRDEVTGADDPRGGRIGSGRGDQG